MPTDDYIEVFGNYWRDVDDKIHSLILSHVIEGDNILEIGFGSGHYMASLSENKSLHISGIEIREDSFETTKNRLAIRYPSLTFVCGDVMEYSGNFDLAYSTGLIQCLKPDIKDAFLKKVASISRKAIYTVPKILNDRNVGSKDLIGVSGCQEYQTGDIAYRLSKIYKYVETGEWKKEDIDLEDDYIWFYCNNVRL